MMIKRIVSPFKALVALTLVLVALMLPLAVRSAPAAPADDFCVRWVAGHQPGNNLWRCYCDFWAPNHKICLRWHWISREEYIAKAR